jgi:molecular chaperone DnaJ
VRDNAAFADEDLYAALGVAPDASAEEIVLAFRRASMKHHPDRRSAAGDTDDAGLDQYSERDAARQQQLLNHAYETLRDAGRRRSYDDAARTLRARASEPGRGRRGAGAADGGDGRGGRDGDRYEGSGRTDGRNGDVEGEEGDDGLGRAWRPGQRPGGRAARRTLSRRVEISLHEQIFGGTAYFSINDYVQCARCAGEGMLDDGVAACPRCRGGPSSPSCATCGGLGRIQHRSPCPACLGKARRKTGDREVPFVLRPGLRSGDRIEIDQDGLFGPDGKPCIVEIEISVAAHPMFTTRHPDLLCSVPVGLFHLLAGLPVNVPLVDGFASLTPEPASLFSPDGPLARIAGQGMRAGGGARGDLVVRFEVMPQGLAARRRDTEGQMVLSGLAAEEERLLSASRALADWRLRMLAHGGGPVPSASAGRKRRARR